MNGTGSAYLHNLPLSLVVTRHDDSAARFGQIALRRARIIGEIAGKRAVVDCIGPFNDIDPSRAQTRIQPLLGTNGCGDGRRQ
jgi:hypothetical protein